MNYPRKFREFRQRWFLKREQSYPGYDATISRHGLPSGASGSTVLSSVMAFPELTLLPRFLVQPPHLRAGATLNLGGPHCDHLRQRCLLRTLQLPSRARRVHPLPLLPCAFLTSNRGWICAGRTDGHAVHEDLLSSTQCGSLPFSPL